MSAVRSPPDTHKEGGEEDGGQGDQAGQHHLGGDLRATAPQDGGEDLEHHPDEEHEVDVGQGQPQQVQHTVFTGGACRGEPTDENSIVVVVPAVVAAGEEVEEIVSLGIFSVAVRRWFVTLKKAQAFAVGIFETRFELEIENANFLAYTDSL